MLDPLLKEFGARSTPLSTSKFRMKSSLARSRVSSECSYLHCSASRRVQGMNALLTCHFQLAFDSDRWIHLPSGRVYNLGYNNLSVPGHDDITREPLTKRPDDRSVRTFARSARGHKAD